MTSNSWPGAWPGILEMESRERTMSSDERVEKKKNKEEREAQRIARIRTGETLFRAIEVLVQCGHKDLALEVRAAYDTYFRVGR